MKDNERSLTVHRPSLVATAAALALFAILMALPAVGNTAPAATATVSTATTGLGRVLVTSTGHTLYMFGKDKNGKSACVGQCATFWPPLITTGKPKAGSGARAALIGTTKRADGRLQVTYNHHPLYTFVKDTKKGQTNGEAVSAFGAVWDAVSPAGAKVQKTNSGSSPGYSP